MQVEQLIQLLQQRSPKQDICIEIFGTQFQIKDVEINNEHSNGVKISIDVDDCIVTQQELANSDVDARLSSFDFTETLQDTLSAQIDKDDE
jgi:hypothetical protein